MEIEPQYYSTDEYSEYTSEDEEEEEEEERKLPMKIDSELSTDESSSYTSEEEGEEDSINVEGRQPGNLPHMISEMNEYVQVLRAANESDNPEELWRNYLSTLSDDNPRVKPAKYQLELLKVRRSVICCELYL